MFVALKVNELLLLPFYPTGPQPPGGQTLHAMF